MPPAEPEKTSDLKAGSDSSTAPADTQTSASPQEPTMLEVHGTHEPIHSWKSFLTHIGAIAIGLLLALGLEQTVEAIHHRHQRQEIEAQMHAVLVDDLELDNRALAQLKLLRDYFVELRGAIRSRLTGSTLMSQPAVRDPRTAGYPQMPTLAPYEVAQRNGTVSWLPAERIRLYDRLELTRSFLIEEATQWLKSQEELYVFQERYVDSQGVPYLGSLATAPNIDGFSPAELNEYLAHVSRVIKDTDVLYAYHDMLDQECRAVLAGARTDNDLVNSARRARPHGFGVDVNNLEPRN
jgi:hypothetical protein